MPRQTSHTTDNHPILKALALLGLSIGLIVFVVGGYFTYTTKQISDAVTSLPNSGVSGSDDLAENWIDVITANRNEASSPLNILLLGSDSRQGQGNEFGSADIYTGARSDTAMLIHLNKQRNRAVSMSIPRDLLVPIPACIRENGTESLPTFARFNSAFDIGGPACTISTVKSLTGLNINHVIVVDFKGFQQVVDSLGGLKVCLTQPVTDKKAKVTLPAGTLNLSGEEALGLARARYTLADGSDLARIVRQQAIVRAGIRQVTESGIMRDPTKLREVLITTASSLSTDEQLASFEALASLALQVRDIPIGNIEFITFPWYHTGDRETVSIDQDRLAPIVAALAADDLPLKKPEPVEPRPAGGPSSGRAEKAISACSDPVI